MTVRLAAGLVALHGAIEDGASDAEQIGQFGGAVLALPKEGHKVRLLTRVELGLLTAQLSLGLGHLTAAVGGQAQALLLNYEEELTTQFGEESSLATRLRFPVFIGSFTDEGERTLRRLRKQLPKALRTFIAKFDAGLDGSITEDPRYELRHPESPDSPGRFTASSVRCTAPITPPAVRKN